MSGSRLTLPNVITAARIAVCPAIFVLAMAPGVGERFWAFVLFVAAGLSDVWDGYLARRYGWITDVGKLLDPLADKLLLAVTFIPFYLISHRGGPLDELPWWGAMPLWVVLVIFGRELLITVFRSYAAGKGVVIAAGPTGKRKTLLQSLFTGGLLLWYPLSILVQERHWEGHGLWRYWSTFHGLWIAVTLGLAILLTIYSMLDYLWRYRAVLGIRS
ncbi:MAG TPA: CDP-diacylglycerol--glycerol-3-phosphate 3-phosphatidyltransferase [Longimicrobiales bacterium]|nr:CDP-diacylglycerol--glycerol-3-phosphate 3-phosphatidyltransferase [Longimicrobiales bacterium]